MATKQYHHGDLKNALIKAGVEIVTEAGVNGLSLRKVAQRAGVSHNAPYAHFADKQELIAAISTEGYRRLYDRLQEAIQRYQDNPKEQFVEAAWAYVRFALDDPGHFKITLSGAVEKEQSYPAFVEISKKSFAALVHIVENCQAAGILNPGPADALAVSVWSLVHGYVALLLESQISHTVFEHRSVREQLIFSLSQITRIVLEP